MTQLRRKAVPILVILTGPLAFLLTYLACLNHLPKRIPDPWDWSAGRLGFDDSIDTDPFSLLLRTALFSTVFLGVAVVLIARSKDGRVSPRQRQYILGASFGGSMGLFLTMKSILISYNAPSVQSAHPQFWQLLLTYVAMGAYTNFVASTLLVAAPTPAVVTSDLRLERGQRITWYGQASSSRTLGLALAMVAASVAVAVVSPSASLAVLLAAVLPLLRYMVKVRIDDHGITITSNPIGWPRRTVPLEQIVGASSRRFKSLNAGLKEEGGQGDPRSRLIRRGDILVINTKDHLPIYLSVDHAGEAADVVNALVMRNQRRASGRSDQEGHSVAPNARSSPTGTPTRFERLRPPQRT
jgi:hypothetical protein